MASQKKTIDVIGSIDDYALEPSIDTPPTRVDDNTWSSPRIIFSVAEKVLAGDNFTPTPADPSFVVGENRWGDKMVWALKPYCVSCSPAAKKIDDDKQTATFDEMGAEMVMSIRESRLKNLSPSNYYSFTLVERNGKLHCKKCEGKMIDSNDQNAKIELFGHEKKIVYAPATFDVDRPMLGVKVDEGVFRYPQKLVSYWVESDGFENQKIYVLRKNKIYSIIGKEFIKKAIFEANNNQWLLNPQYCEVKETLEGFIENNLLKVHIESVIEWRKSAIPLSVMIVAEYECNIWSIKQEDFLKRGYKQNQSWVIPLQSCGNPLMGLKDIEKAH